MVFFMSENILNKKEIADMKSLFKNIGENGRLCYVLNCNIIETLMVIYYNRKIETSSIHRWFKRTYLNKISTLNFPDMARDYMKEKFPLFIWNEEEFCTIFSKMNEGKNFKSLQEYSEFVINEDLQENSVNEVYQFIVEG